MFYMRLEGILLDWGGVHTVLAFSEGLASLYTFYCLELKIYTLALTVLTECDYKHHMHSFPVFPLLCSSLSPSIHPNCCQICTPFKTGFFQQYPLLILQLPWWPHIMIGYSALRILELKMAPKKFQLHLCRKHSRKLINSSSFIASLDHKPQLCMEEHLSAWKGDELMRSNKVELDVLIPFGSSCEYGWLLQA